MKGLVPQAAFPSSTETFGDFAGMSLRDYFAAHAPSIPYAWFEPVMGSERPEFEGVRNASGEFESTNQDVIDAWKLEHYKQQCIQWPYAWADLMVAARVKS